MTRTNEAKRFLVSDEISMYERYSFAAFFLSCFAKHDSFLSCVAKHDSEAYSDTVLGLCVACDEWESVLEVLDIMKRQGLSQERSSYRACLRACFEAGNGNSAQEILNAMEQALVKPDTSDIALVIAAICRRNKSEQGYWRRALSLIKFSASDLAGINGTLPVDAYDAVLSCMVEERQWKDAVKLLRLMQEGSSSKSGGTHPAPELSTYRSVIECCVSAAQAEQAVQVLYSMKDLGLQVCLSSSCVSLSSLRSNMLLVLNSSRRSMHLSW